MDGRRSAAEIESLRDIHDAKLYRKSNRTWDEFCSRHAQVSSRTIDREFVCLRRFGPAFFTLRQLVRLSVRDYAAIADHVTPEGIQINGSIVAMLPENRDTVSEAVKTLLGGSQPKPAGFDAVLQRLRTANQTLGAYRRDLDQSQMRALASEMVQMLSGAAALGVALRVAG